MSSLNLNIFVLKSRYSYNFNTIFLTVFYQKILISRAMSLNFSLFNIKRRRHKRSHSAVPIPKNLKFVLIPFKSWIQKAFYPIMLWLLDCRGKKEKKEHKTPEGQRQIHKKTSLLFKNFQSRLCYLLGIFIFVFPLISL